MLRDLVLAPIEAALLRAARGRILCLEERLSDRFDPNDSELRRLERKLSEERNSLSERLRRLEARS